jgi:quinoprotein glucose dehydrogenase
LLTLVANSAEPLDVRVAALRALHQLGAEQLGAAIEVALMAKEPELRLTALPLSIQLAPKTAIAILVKLLANGTVLEKRAAFKALGTAPQAEADDVLLLQLERLATGHIEPSAQLELVAAAALRPDSRVKQALVARAALLAKDPDPLAAFRVALEGGDAKAGRELFNNHPVMQCSRCHRDSDEPGGEAGPNLAGIGGREPREYILQSILQPSAKFAAGFEIVTITKKNGAVLVGTIIERDEKIVRLRTSATDPVEIAQADIQSLVSTPSAMPEIAALVMTKTEIRDLVAAVAALRTVSRRTELTPPRALVAPPID